MLKKIWEFYRDGFLSMRLGRTLWGIILIKLAIMFLILKIFFFPSQLRGLDKEQKAEKVATELTQID